MKTVNQISQWYNANLPHLLIATDEDGVASEFFEWMGLPDDPLGIFFSSSIADWTGDQQQFLEDWRLHVDDDKWSPLLVLFLFSPARYRYDWNQHTNACWQGMVRPNCSLFELITYIRIALTMEADTPIALPLWMKTLSRLSYFSRLLVINAVLDAGWLHQDDTSEPSNLFAISPNISLGTVGLWGNLIPDELKLHTQCSLNDCRRRHNIMVLHYAKLLAYRNAWDMTSSYPEHWQLRTGSHTLSNWEKLAALSMFQMILWCRLQYEDHLDPRFPGRYPYQIEPPLFDRCTVVIGHSNDSPYPAGDADVTVMYEITLTPEQSVLQNNNNSDNYRYDRTGFPVLLGYGHLVSHLRLAPPAVSRGTRTMAQVLQPKLIPSWGVFTQAMCEFIRGLQRPSHPILDQRWTALMPYLNPELLQSAPRGAQCLQRIGGSISVANWIGNSADLSADLGAICMNFPSNAMTDLSITTPETDTSGEAIYVGLDTAQWSMYLPRMSNSPSDEPRYPDVRIFSWVTSVGTQSAYAVLGGNGHII